MSNRSLLLLSGTLTLLGFLSSAQAVTVQDPGNVLDDGSAFLFVEGENVDVLATADGSRGDPTTGWMIVDKNNPIQTITQTAADPPLDVVKGGLDVLPADTNASGGAALFNQLGSGGATTATWEVQFAIPATYFVYPHWTLYNRDDNTSYGNEDSYYLPPSFGANSRSDWVGFEGVDEFGDAKTGDSDRDGYIDGFARIVNVNSGGIEEFHNSTDEDYWDGQFHWHLASPANDMDANNAFVSFNGHGIQYEVTPDDVGTVLTFQISSREPYGAIDALLFSTSNLLLDDFTQEEMDEFFLTGGEPAQLQAGDANQDLNFDQVDLVQVQVAAKYLTGQAATWGEGDWNGAPGGSPGSPPTGDGLFNQGDIVASQQAGTYLTGPYAAVAPAPPEWDTDEQTTLVYNPTSGELAVNAPASTELTSINIDSAAAIFTGDPAQNLGGSFDNDADNNIFKATFGSSFGSLSFGNVAQTGLAADFVLNDLTVIGSLAGGGDLGNVDLVYVPEPATAVLMYLGLAGAVLLSLRQRG